MPIPLALRALSQASLSSLSRAELRALLSQCPSPLWAVPWLWLLLEMSFRFGRMESLKGKRILPSQDSFPT